MARKGTYYLGRVIKVGYVETKDIVSAILNPIPIGRRGVAWTFINVREVSDGKGSFVYGLLSKYSPDAEVRIVDPSRKMEVTQHEPNLSVATSPFVYIPEYAGIAFLHVSNHIEYKTFFGRWCDVVRASMKGIFMDVEIEPITDLRTFAIKLKNLDGIYQISATVSPPNPLFGPLWKGLKEYLDERRSGRMKIEEESTSQEPISTDLPEHVGEIVSQTKDRPYDPEPLPIGDAAILMAADGYGAGFVRGKQGDEMIVIKTSETVRNFRFAREPEPMELYYRAAAIFQRISEERHMEHDE
jgi:hypothetical protein